jgi:hypothetical protein
MGWPKCPIRVEGGQGLKGDEHEGDIEAAGDDAEKSRGRVGEHIAEDQIEIGRFQPGQHRVGRLRVVDEAELEDLDPLGLEFSDQYPQLAQQFLAQPIELRPIRMEPHPEDTDAGGEWFSTRDAGRVHGQWSA